MAAWPGWATSVLFDLGVPDTQANVKFLEDWHKYEESNCKNNPLNTTLVTKASSDCAHVSGSTYVQSYATRRAGATATANTLRGQLYVAVVAALKGGDPYTFGVPQAVANGITAWGTPRYAAYYLSEVGKQPQLQPPPVTSGGANAKASPDMQAGAAWNRLMRTLAIYTPHQLARTRAAGARIRKAVR